MPQYWKYSEGSYQYRTNTATGFKVRFGQRGGLWVTDKELAMGGFLLAEGVGWENIAANAYAIVGDKAREGVRSAYYVVDAEDDATGFGGAENTNWTNIEGAN